jgi:RNA-dependent RNA polymerase
MKMHSRDLTHHVEKTILNASDVGTATKEELLTGLERAWNAWCFSAQRRKNEGGPSFGLVALGLMFSCIDRIDCPLEL